MKKDLIIISKFLLLFFIAFFITYGIVSKLYVRPKLTKQANLISEQKNTINRQALRIENLERCCRWAKVLEQILPPLSQYELDLMEEQIAQWKINKNNLN